jgi:pimeloyl-ACP methyl ester carboxylesterase
VTPRPGRSRRWLHALAWTYAASLVTVAAVALHPGRLALVSRFGLAPDIRLPVTDRTEDTRHLPDGSTTVDVRQLPAELSMPLLGRPQSPPLRIYSHSPRPRCVWFVCPAGGGRGERWAQMAWMALRTDDAAAVGFAWEREGGNGPFVLETVDDVAAAAFATSRSLYPDVPVVVFGASLGCAPALQLAAAHEDIVRGVVLDSPGDLRHEIGRRWWLSACPPLFVLTAPWLAAAVPPELDQLALARDLPAALPVLLLTNVRDPITDPLWPDTLAAVLGQRARIVRGNGTQHCRLVDRLLPEPEPVLEFVAAAVARR